MRRAKAIARVHSHIHAFYKKEECLFVFPNDKEKQCLNFLYSQVGQPLFTYIIPVSDCVCSMNVSEFSSNGKQTPSHEISLAFCLIQNI